MLHFFKRNYESRMTMRSVHNSNIISRNLEKRADYGYNETCISFSIGSNVVPGLVPNWLSPFMVISFVIKCKYFFFHFKFVKIIRYIDITSSTRFFALAAIYDFTIIGLIVAEIKPYIRLNKEVSRKAGGFFPIYLTKITSPFSRTKISYLNLWAGMLM